jgi:hypothetical protein
VHVGALANGATREVSARPSSSPEGGNRPAARDAWRVEVIPRRHRQVGDQPAGSSQPNAFAQSGMDWTLGWVTRHVA